MNANELIDIASEQSREWMEIWGLFVFVLMGMLGGMVTMGSLEKSRSLPPGGADALTGARKLVQATFLIFSVMHYFTIQRHYDVHEVIAALAMTELSKEQGQMLEILAPFEPRWVVYAAYWMFVVASLFAIRLTNMTPPAWLSRLRPLGLGGGKEDAGN